jgi:hypothetical protein
VSTTHQTAVSETDTAQTTPVGGISSLVVYAVSTLLIAAAVTAGGLIATRDDPATSTGPATAQASGQQFIDGIDPSINVAAALGLPAPATTVDSATALVDAIDPSINVPAALGLPAPATVEPESATSRKR